jgi:hypothetical protein
MIESRINTCRQTRNPCAYDDNTFLFWTAHDKILFGFTSALYAMLLQYTKISDRLCYAYINFCRTESNS